MTKEEARRRAVEAAEDAMCRICETESATSTREYVEAVAVAYERAMADAGWRMVRDVEGVATVPHISGANSAYSYNAGHSDGWNACRAAMLEDGE